MLQIKTLLHSLCLAYINQRIDTAQKAIEIAQASANEETKSSAGDKYETGRAMMQLEIEKNSVQLAEAMKLKKALTDINPEKETITIQPGSAVITNQGNFYISISAGQLKVNDQIYFAISPVSPIGAKLIGLKEGDQIAFNNKEYRIVKVI